MKNDSHFIYDEDTVGTWYKERMAVETIIDEELGIAVQTIDGDLTLEDVVAAQRLLYVDMSFDPRKPCLWDSINGNIATAMDFGGMQESVQRSRSMWERMAGGKTAILVGRTSDFGMGRMYAQLAEKMPREIRVFEIRDEAIAWLLSD